MDECPGRWLPLGRVVGLLGSPGEPRGLVIPVGLVPGVQLAGVGAGVGALPEGGLRMCVRARLW